MRFRQKKGCFLRTAVVVEKQKKILWKCNVVVYGRLMAELEKRTEQTINGTASLFFLFCFERRVEELTRMSV